MLNCLVYKVTSNVFIKDIDKISFHFGISTSNKQDYLLP